MNAQQFGSDPTDIRVNPGIRITIPLPSPLRNRTLGDLLAFFMLQSPADFHDTRRNNNNNNNNNNKHDNVYGAVIMAEPLRELREK